MDALGQPVGDHLGEQFGRGVDPGKGRIVVEIVVTQRADDGAQLVGSPPDVDHNVVVVEGGPPERRIDDVGRAVKVLRGPEHLAAEAVRDHHVVAHCHTEHGVTSLRNRWCGTGRAVDRRRAAPSRRAVPGMGIHR